MPSTITDRLNGLTTSVAVKPPCVVAAGTNLTLSGLQTVNGVALAQDDRVLCIGQTDNTENGIYIADSGDWTRARDFDGARDAVRGTLVLVSNQFVYELTSADPIVFGSSAITFFLRGGLTTVINNPQLFGALGDGVTDDTLALQRFFDAISAADVRTAVCDGDFAISAGIFIGPAAGSMLTLRIAGNATFRALNAIDTMVTTRNCQGLVWDGKVIVLGTGSAAYSTRTCRIGLKVGDSGLTSRMKFGHIRIQFLSQVGLSLKQLSSLNDMGDVQAYDCGSGMSAAGQSLEASWSNKVDAGSSGSTGQTSRIDVTQMPPATVETPTMVVIGTNVHYVTATDVPNSRITLFPWIDTSLASGTLRYLFGAGIYLQGSDASVLGLNQADVQRCGAGLWSAALYGPVVTRLVTQFCCAGMILGLSPSNAYVGTQVNGLYCEGNDFDVIRLTRAAIGANIVSEYAVDTSKFRYAGAPRTSANLLVYGTGAAFSTISFNRQGIYHQYLKQPENAQDAASSLTLDITAEPNWFRTFKRNSWTINLSIPSTGLNLAFGYDTGTLVCLGTNTNGSPTGTFTFNPPLGSTVNGTTVVTFTGFSGPAMFVIHYNYTTLDYTVRCLNNVLTGSATYNPPSLATTIGATTTVTVTGAALGDYAQCSFSLDTQSIELYPFVSATDTVSVRFQNNTGGTIDLASGTLRARVIKSS